VQCIWIESTADRLTDDALAAGLADVVSDDEDMGHSMTRGSISNDGAATYIAPTLIHGTATNYNQDLDVACPGMRHAADLPSPSLSVAPVRPVTELEHAMAQDGEHTGHMEADLVESRQRIASLKSESE